ncbi:DUF4843 domain-containing protein [Carboxylicivirga sediminis]|uniref:DUF4843 domain-containing protein n=1 Tax=Carboxylicivirga sediminis TaxID=2006564 RepID=A0A941F3Y8_9BACT|nr:DUF4843 domain-containing protein [Carboxylicivirga sediminis]MBR8536403.1 DUF4843 domain-containing protein [Carboxylicivirga sediminis]
MKKYISQFAAIVLLILSGACTENNLELYDGPSMIHFLETTNSVLVDETNPVVSIEVGVTKALETDRVFNVEIDPNGTSAVEGISFELLTPQVTIKAGEVLGNVQVQGLYEGAEPDGQSIKLMLSATNTEWVADFQNSYYLELYKFCDFEQSAFIGTFKVLETDYWQNTFEYEVEAVAGDDPYSIYVTGLWAVNEPVKISFDRKEPTCSIPAQYFFDDGNYENAWIRSLEDGTYNTCMGTIKGLNYFVYPEGSNQGWDLGTFDMVRIK